jgi:regulator of protease activity HflC (stomatin/prohibitin superfamily)
LTELGPSDKVMPECFNAIDPPAPITQAREKQMRADRDKRAASLTAEGVRQSQVRSAASSRKAKTGQASKR